MMIVWWLYSMSGDCDAKFECENLFLRNIVIINVIAAVRVICGCNPVKNFSYKNIYKYI